MNFKETGINTKSTPLWAGLAVFLLIALSILAAASNEIQSLELNVQMVPGIWIKGTNGPVRLEYTTNPRGAGGWTPLATLSASNIAYFYKRLVFHL